MKIYLDQIIFRRLQRPDAFVLRPVEGPNHAAQWPEPLELQGLKGSERRLALEALAKTLKPFIVYDANRDCIGLGIKVTVKNATVIIQRRVRSGNGSGNVIRPTIGKAGDFKSIDDARAAGRAMADDIKKYRTNPKKIQRESDTRDVTLKAALDEYRKHLVGRMNQPAKPNTLKAFDKAYTNMVSLHNKRMSQLRGEDIFAIFMDMAVGRGIVTSAEQTMRWGSVSVKRAIEEEAATAQETQTPTVFHANPFDILLRKGAFRTKAQLEASYAARGVRNPLSLRETLGPWLKGVCGRRSQNRTGCDYLLLATLWGCRKDEALDLKWRDLIDDDEANKSSYVDLENRLVFFRDTKNRRDHTLPLGIAAYRILEERRAMANMFRDEEPWRDPWKRLYVFPTRSSSRMAKTKHYTDPRSLILYVCQDIGYTKTSTRKDKDGKLVSKQIAAIGMHDLRRTFATIVESMMSLATTKKLLNHFARQRSQSDVEVIDEAAEMSIALSRGLRNADELSDVTTSYSKAEWHRRSEAIQRIEAKILGTYPALYNKLLPPDYPPIQEADAPVIQLDKDKEAANLEAVIAEDVEDVE